MSEETPAREGPVTIKLLDPFQWGDSETVAELTLTPTPRAFKDVGLLMKADGSILFQPYPLAQVGMKLAGRPSVAVDKLSVRDMNALATAVLGFFA
jgi:hypothetical protein